MSLKSVLEGRVLRLTLNRPQRRNALDSELCRSLLEALAEADEDRGVGAILLSGAGGFFCSGMDLKEVSEADGDELFGLHARLFDCGVTLKTPLVAAVEGGALAGGLGLALNAHFALADTEARFGLTEVKIGMWPYAIFRAVERAVGRRRAVQLSLEGEVFGAARALRLGVVDAVIADGRVVEEGAELARRLAASSATAIRDGLEFVREIGELGPDEAAQAVGRFRKRAQATEDFAEGVRAFGEKRRAVWPSHRKEPA